MMSAYDSVGHVARLLKRGGLGSIFAAVFEAAGPLRVLGAQAAFIFNPILSADSDVLMQFGEILEDPDAFADLIGALRDEDSE